MSVRIIFFFLICSNLFAQNQVWKNTQLEASIGLGSDYIDNKQVEARVFGVTGIIDMTMPWSDTFHLDVEFGAALETGSNNSFIIDEYAPSRLWILREAKLDWEPFSFLEINAGAISTEDYNSPLLISGGAFLGVSEKIELNLTDKHAIYVQLLQAIPNNLNLTQRIGVVQDGTPNFFMHTFGLDLDGDLLAIDAQFSKYSYNSLSTGIAYNSQFLGNEVTPGSRINSDFLYGYSGYNAAIDTQMSFTDSFGLNLFAQLLYNDKAPEKRNKGFLYRAGLTLGYYTFGVESFRNESDASVAFYNAKTYSHNNHEGASLYIDYADDDGLSFNVRYVDSSPIIFDTFQSPTKKVALGLSQELDF